MIPHSRPLLGEADAEAVARVVRGGHLAQGPEVAAFEGALTPRLGVETAAAVSSGTAALALALRALGVGPGDEVVIPTYVCDALYHAVAHCGAIAVLADADPLTLSLSAADAARRAGPRTRAVIVPHAFGLAADLVPFEGLGLPLIEDCAQALGAVRDGRPVGGRGRLAVGSFYATKLLTTGEGGVVGGPADLVRRVRETRDYDERDDLVPRFNFKLTDLQAALGLSQLVRFDAFLARRRAIADRYRKALGGLACRLPEDVGPAHVYHRFVVRVRAPVAEIVARLGARGVVARRPVFRPLHVALGLRGFPEADRLWDECLSLPCYPALTDAEVDRVAETFADVLQAVR